MKSNFLKIYKALIISVRMVFLMTCLRLPLTIWMVNVNFLERLYGKFGVEKDYLNSELKIFSWLNLFLSGIIFLTYPIGLGLIISLFFKGFNWENIFGKLFFLSIATYFSPLVLSFIKEVISLSLLKYFRIESIEEKVRRIEAYQKEK